LKISENAESQPKDPEARPVSPDIFAQGKDSQSCSQSCSFDQKYSDQMAKRQTQRLIQNLVAEHIQAGVHDIYDTAYGKVLGSGISGTVRAVRHKITKVEYAMKTLSKERIISENKMQELKNEIELMKEVDHPNIIRLMEVFETDHHIFLIIELCTGGELLQRLQSQPHYHYSEITAMQLVRKIVSAVKYLHNQHIVHRDLKLENFLFENKSAFAELKLIDFGFSQHFQESQELSVPVGTPFYVAPEVLRSSYNHKCDMWSIGIITYMLLSGRPAFFGENQKEILQSVKRGKFDFPDEIFKFVSPLAKDFISKLLVVDPAERMSAEECQRHPWLARDDDANCNPEPVSIEVIESLRDFHKHSKLKRVALEVIAYSLSPEKIALLREDFLKIDQSQSGELTFQDFEAACKNSGLVKEGDLELIFNSVDVGHSGKIHWIEFLAATIEKSMLDEESIRAAFNRIDVRKAGVITALDLKQLVGIDMTQEQVNEMIEEVTNEQNGELTCEEFVRLIKGSSTSDGRASRRFKFWNVGASGLLSRVNTIISRMSISESLGMSGDEESWVAKARSRSASTSNGPGNTDSTKSPRKTHFNPFVKQQATNKQQTKKSQSQNFNRSCSTPEHTGERPQHPAGKRVQTCADVDNLPHDSLPAPIIRKPIEKPHKAETELQNETKIT